MSKSCNNPNHSRTFTAWLLPCVFPTWTDLLINTGASARWRDAHWTSELFQQFVERGRKLLKQLLSSTLNNCIVYFNTAPQGTNYDSLSTLNYCCSVADPGGTRNITKAPLFVDQASGNLRLQSNSTCINAGNNSYVTTATDLDGNPRIVGGTVDIGAYEYQSLDLLNSGVVSNHFGFNVTGQSNWVIVLEASSDFTNWTPLTTNTLGGSPFPFPDPTPPNLPQRFYRPR